MLFVGEKMQVQLNALKVFSIEPDWLLAYREKNEAIFKSAPLQKSKYSNLVELNNLLTKESNNEPLVLPLELQQSGVLVLDWQTALDSFEAELRTALEGEAPARDQFEAFVNAHFDSGFVLIVSSKTKPDAVLSWNTCLSANALAKTVVIVQSDVQNLHLFETTDFSAGRLNQTVLVKSNARVFWVRNLQSRLNGLLSVQCILKKDAFLHAANAWVHVVGVRNQATAVLEGSGSQMVQRDWVLGGGVERFDLSSWAIHQAPSTVSHSVFKSVLDQKAYCVFEGMIKILPQAQQSNAFLEAYGLLLSDTASNNNIPGLEIEADDVKATHSASVSHVDDEALFYLRSRGISEKEAKQMIVMGFLESLVHELPKPFWEPLTEAIETKWHQINQAKPV